ncbi:MAG: hypothetical protein ABDI20_06540 [Candidatus Bipolaricaulaceae bacterium]
MIEVKHPDYPSHPVRSAQEQAIHDQLIQDLAQRLRRRGYHDVKPNPGQEKNASVPCGASKTLWPDVVVKEGNRFILIFEVETASTVDKGSADQWEDYAKCVKDASFVLVVPKGKEVVAKEILESRRIPYKEIMTYPF